MGTWLVSLPLLEALVQDNLRLQKLFLQKPGQRDRGEYVNMSDDGQTGLHMLLCWVSKLETGDVVKASKAQNIGTSAAMGLVQSY